MILETKRLILRPWKQSDFEPFATMNADARVREFFPSVLGQEESDASAKKIKEHIDQAGWGLWAVEVKGGASFIGFVGIQGVSFDAPFTPAVEIAWRLAPEHWEKGYALEAAKAALFFGFDILELSEIVSFALPSNERSLRLMEKLGMKRDLKGDFIHPELPKCALMLYRIARSDFMKANKACPYSLLL